MRNRRTWIVIASIFVEAGLVLVSASAQTTVDKKALLNQRLAKLANMPVAHQNLMSSGMRRILQIGQVLNNPRSKIGGDGGSIVVPPKVGAAPVQSAAAAAAIAALAPLGPIPGRGRGGTIRVSDPRLNFANSVMSGFTQSETSSAWCGNTVVVGYNDSGAFARTAGVNFDSAWSFSSASYSHDGGRTFTDIGYLNPGTNVATFIAGDPVIACTSPTQFYYSSIFASGQDSSLNFFNGVAVNTSSDGGQTWSDPVAAVAKDFNHGIDKPWIAADPTNPAQLFVTYTDFDYSGFAFPPDPTAHCPDDIRTAIELVSSSDAGVTWGAPVVVDEECLSVTNNSVQGSNPAVSADGTVYVGYEFYPGALPNNEIHVGKSTNHGQSFAVVKVADVWPNGNFGFLQGGFRNNEFPQIAVDRSRGPSKGTVYVTWSDGIDNIVQDLPFFFDTYAYPDVFVAKSTNGGASYSSPTVVSPTPYYFRGQGRDQFFPGIAVDRRGNVGVCYYDRRENPLNLVIDRYCSVSQNHGRTWEEQQVSDAQWIPAHASDGVINQSYIGDYDALSSDFLLQQNGFFSSFEVQTNANPDVVGAQVH